jgi:hypothetical protein
MSLEELLFAVESALTLANSACRWCPCIVAKNIAPEADQNPCLCCLGTLSVFSGGAFPIFLLTGCMLRKAFVEKQNIQDDGALCHLACGGICHNLNLCQMARELGSAGDSGVQRMER